MQYTTEEVLRLPGKGEAKPDMTVKFRATELGGDFSIMEGAIEPDQLLVPHTHTHEDQAVYVINGLLHFEVGGEGGLVFEAPAGSYVRKPRGVAHAFWNKGKETARYIELSGKANFERFTDAAEENVAVASVTAPIKHGLTFHFEEISRLLRTYGLTSIRGADVPEPIMKMLKLLP